MDRADFDPRELAQELSEAILKGKTAKNKKVTPVRCGTDSDNSNIHQYLSWGTSVLDAATCGLPCGRVTMVYGDPSSGKSLLAESAILAAQMRGGVGFVIDSEATFNKPRFAAKGGDIDQVMFVEVRAIEDGFEYINKIAKSMSEKKKFEGKPIVIVWDTIATNQTRNMVKGNEYAAGMMEAPRVINKGLRDITEIIASTNVALLILNQVYGDKVAPGGKGLKFHSSLILYLEEVGPYHSFRTNSAGKLLKAQMMKSKIGPPTFLDLFFACDGQGVDDTMSLYFNCRKRGKGAREVNPGVFGYSGSWESYTFDDKEKVAWQNEEGFYKRTVEYPELVEELAVKMWGIFPPGEPSSTLADEEFVEKYVENNPWVREERRHAKCLISDHMCPVSMWKACSQGYWTECMMELDDVEPLERIYHAPPEDLQDGDEDYEEEEEDA
jgi:recombination protein RecA